MYFTDESAKEIQRAFMNRKPISSKAQDMDYIKAFYRARWDYLSMQFTRIATALGDGKSVLRQGRLKSCMIVLVGNALKELAEYKKVPYYQNRFKDENGVVYTNPDEPCFPDKDSVPAAYTSSRVVIDSRDIKHTAPPKLLDLAALSSKLASSGYKPKHVMEVYQKMYESQVVSYPRTEDKVITPEQFNELLPLVDKIAAVVGTDSKLLTHRTPRSTHVKTGGAHGANRPGTNVPDSLNDLLKYGDCAPDIYEILAKNYLAMLAEDYEYESQKGHVEKYPAFKGSAAVPKKPGWKLVFNPGTDDDPDENAAGLGTNAEPYIHEGFPPKPPTPTMSWLMAQLEKRNVGTGATRTSTFAEITNDSAKYPLLVNTRGRISMTQYGEMSYRLLPGTNIGSLDVTERVWNEMHQIAEGKFNPDAGLHDMQRMVMEDIETMKKNSVSMKKELNIMAGSGSDVERYSGTWNGKQVSFKRVWGDHHFTDDECAKLINGEEISFPAKSKAGKDYTATGKLAEQEYSGHKYVGFALNSNGTGGASGRSQTVPAMWCSHKFTDDEKQQLEAGLTVEGHDFVSKKGNKFSAKLKWGLKDDGSKGIIAEFI
jgi:DNA topoisomerase-3